MTTENTPEVDESQLSDEEWRKLLLPCPSEQQILELLKASYISSPNDEVRIVQQLDSYDDCNYSVQINERPLLLKIHNGVESRDFRRALQASGGQYYRRGHMNSVIHYQVAISMILVKENVLTGIPVKPHAAQDDPRGSPVSLHDLPVVSAKHSPCTLVCRLITWVPGTPMSTIKLLPLETLADAGRFLGRMDLALDRMSPTARPLMALRRSESAGIFRASFARTGIQPPAPLLLLDPDENENDGDESDDDNDWFLMDPSLLTAARRYHQWDGKNTVDLRNFTQYIPDIKRRELVESIIDAFQREIVDTGLTKQFRKGINHGDYNDANILVDDNMQVSGVIDFGDSTESWRVFDISVAMAYALLSTYGKANRSISAAAALLRGYNAVYPLTELERKHLVLFMACRLACSVTLGAYSMQRNPDNTYLLLHSKPAWTALGLIWSMDDQQRSTMARAMNRVFDQACLHSDARGPIIECYDLVIPDPGVADLLYDVRLSSSSTERPVKRLKPTVDNGNTLITFVSGNANKLVEVQQILGIDNHQEEFPAGTKSSNLPYHLTNQKMELPELQGDPFSVAQSKCLVAVEQVGGPVIIEDTALCFNALNGMPGVYIKWFMESCGLVGLNKMLDGFDDRTAYGQTVVAFCPGPGREVVLFDGRTDGKIVMPRGSLNFGWDPIFEPNEGAGKTYAEMTKEDKNAISHRGRAFAKLRDYLASFRNDIRRPTESE